MSGLYAVKLKKIPSKAVKGRYIDMGNHTGLTKQGVIDLIFKHGISRVMWIRHDDADSDEFGHPFRSKLDTVPG